MSEFKDKKIALTDNFVMSHVGAETVIAPISGSTADMGKLTAINPTGADILEGLREGLGFDGVVNKIMMLYGVTDRQIVEQDATAFINKMIKAGVVTVS